MDPRIEQFLRSRPNGEELAARYEQWRAAPKASASDLPTVRHGAYAAVAAGERPPVSADCRGIASKQIDSRAGKLKTYRMPHRKSGYCRRSTCECCALIPGEGASEVIGGHWCSCKAKADGLCRRCWVDYFLGKEAEPNVFHDPGFAVGSAAEERAEMGFRAASSLNAQK